MLAGTIVVVMGKLNRCPQLVMLPKAAQLHLAQAVVIASYDD
jgi:hypothetical protein